MHAAIATLLDTLILHFKVCIMDKKLRQDKIQKIQKK